MGLFIGPLVAALGLVAAYIVLRSRARHRSLYSTRRALIAERAMERRDRALGGAPDPAPPEAPPRPAPPAPAAPAGPPAWERSPVPPATAPPPPPVPPAPTVPAGPEPAYLPPAAVDPPAPPAWSIVEQEPPEPGDAKAGAERPREAAAMAVLSYAGLAGALIVVLLGVLLMLATTR